MYNFIKKTCPIEFLREFFHSGCAYEAQKECVAKGIDVEVSEELALWMKENARWVTETWAAREQALLRPSTIASTIATKRKVVRLVVLANGALAEEVSWE